MFFSNSVTILISLNPLPNPWSFNVILFFWQKMDYLDYLTQNSINLKLLCSLDKDWPMLINTHFFILLGEIKLFSFLLAKFIIKILFETINPSFHHNYIFPNGSQIIPKNLNITNLIKSTLYTIFWLDELIF